MSLSKKAIGKRFGLLAALVAALLIACTGVVLAQSSSSAPNASYGSTTATPNDVDQTSSSANGTSATGGVSAAAASVPNGNFETGTFSDWSRANRRQPGSLGNWFVYSGTTSPLSGFTIAAPPQGDFAATTDQDGPGSHVLYRNIHLRRNMKHELSFYLYYKNRADRFFTPNTLSFNLDRPNQQYRVDVLRPTANLFTVNDKAILKPLFQTEVGDPNRLAPTLLHFNLTPFAGQTVLLRFAEVENQFYFQASVDRVRVTSTPR